MIQDTCKKIKKSLRSTESGEVVYVEIGMENIQPKVTTEMIVFFLEDLFGEVIAELEDPGTPETTPKEGEGTHELSVEDAIVFSEKEFEKLMDNARQKKRGGLEIEKRSDSAP